MSESKTVNNPKAAQKTVQKTKRVESAQDRDIRRVLVSGEEVILRARVHWAIYWKSVAVLLLSVLIWPLAPPLGLLAGVVGVFMLCVAMMTQHFLLLAITNKRVLARYGLLQMDVVDIRLSMVESIDLERMLPGHLFGYASVVVMGTGQRMIRVQYIANAEAFRRYYNEMVLATEGNAEAEQEIENIKDEVESSSQNKKARSKKKSR